MVLGAIARGLAGRAARGSGSKMAGRVFKREVPASEQTVDVKVTPVVQPSTPLISSSSALNAKDISKASPSIGTETLEGTAFRIKTSLVDVDTLLRGSIALDELKEKSRKKSGKEKEGKDREKQLESATKKNKNKFGLGKLIPTKAKSIFGNIINFFVTLLLGKILMGLLDNTGAFAKLAIGLAAVANFVIDWGGKLFNAFVNLIGFGYGIYDGLRGTVGNLFGEAGLKTFDNLSKTFTLLLNAALIAALTAGRAGILGGGPGLGGLTKVGRGGVKPAAVTRYAQRFGRNAAIKKFGSKAVERYGGTAARSGLTKLGRKGLTSILGKAGSKTFLKTVKRFVSPTVRGIPIIGTLIDFALNLLVFKEPVGKAAFKAIGAGLAAWMGGAIGSIIPGAGTLVGAVLGGWAGDALGGLMYDVFFGNQTVDAAKDDEDESVIQTKSKGLSETMLTGGAAGTVTALQKGKIKKPKIKPKAKVKPKAKRSQIRSKKPGSKAVKQFKKSFTKQRQKLTKAVRPVTRALKPVTQKATKAITKNIVKPASKVATTTTKAVTAAAKGAAKGATTAGKAGLKAASGVLKSAKKIISPIVKKIPFLGPIVDFLLNVFVFKEPLGRSAFMAIGAGLGTWIGGALGTLIPVPGVGTAIGMFLGGAGGDLIGGLLYDKIFADKDPKENGDKDLKENGDKDLNEDLKEDLTEGEKPKVKKISSQKQVSGRFDMKTGKAYINDQEVSADEYANFANLSQREKLNQYGQTPITPKSNDYSGLDTYAGYEEDEGSTTYVVTQKSNSSTNSGTDQGIGGEKELATLAMSSSGSSSNSFKELQKR